MRILLVSLSNSIGMELLLESYSDGLARECTVTILCSTSSSANLPPRCRVLRLGNSVSHWAMARAFMDPFNWLRTYQIIRKARPQCIYIVSPHPLNVVVTLIGRLVRAKPLIASHIHDVFPHKGTPHSWAITLFQSIQILFSQYFTLFGNLLKDQLIRAYKVPLSHVLVVNHGVSRPPRECVCGPNGEKRLISLVGRIDQYKGVEEFLRVARHFDREHNTHLTFILGGEGNLSPYQKDLAGLRNLRLINRRLTNAELDQILQRSLVCLLPYRDGSQSGNIPVAYYNACPVIVTQVGALPEMVKSGETGFVVSPGDTQAMIGHITALLIDPQKRKKMGAAGFSYYLEFMQYSEITSKISAFLGQAVRAQEAEKT